MTHSEHMKKLKEKDKNAVLAALMAELKKLGFGTGDLLCRIQQDDLGGITVKIEPEHLIPNMGHNQMDTLMRKSFEELAEMFGITLPKSLQGLSTQQLAAMSEEELRKKAGVGPKVFNHVKMILEHRRLTLGMKYTLKAKSPKRGPTKGSK
jgi:hypothetical protein